ncbi:hypothetical protein C0Q70_08873 [Pomacea canaliculata]|uniref:G-protein coupled receptors family 1 profile domain-containing protein n=2 Tax=Pomacea canaliculata TaxID=400727 RepID=A0A2T7P876_POMCA|nr:hypothetical protein C0Q70_08873 [Pomacea canaliculata]
MKVEKRAYTVAQMVVQYILPFIILTVAHLRICNKLRYRMVNQQQQQQQQRAPHSKSPAGRSATSPFQRKNDDRRSRRKRKTNLLLGSIAVVFALSWLPLNIFNLLSEFHLQLFSSAAINKTAGEEHVLEGSVNINLAYAICHLLVLCSACVNPVVYGWFNDNFKVEFLKILVCPCCTQLKVAIKRILCCKRSKPEVPSITLTKASNGNGSYGAVGHCDEGDGEKLSTTCVDAAKSVNTYLAVSDATIHECV